MLAVLGVPVLLMPRVMPLVPLELELGLELVLPVVLQHQQHQGWSWPCRRCCTWCRCRWCRCR